MSAFYYFTVPHPGSVTIHEDVVELRYDEASLRQRIENVKANKDWYANEQVWQNELAMLQEAMRTLKAGQK